MKNLFEWRINRKNYILSLLLITFLFLTGLRLCYAIFPEWSWMLFIFLWLVFLIRTFFVVSLAIRRFHDFSQKWTWVWLMIILGEIITLFLCFYPGKKQSNKYWKVDTKSNIINAILGK